MARPTEIIEGRNLEQAFAQSAVGALAPRAPDDVVIAERTLFGEVITAQKIAVPRDEAKVLQRIKTMAAASGSGWYYRFPVRKKGGGTDYIEGPSIDCADAVARYYGNCRVDSAVVDQGRSWLIYSRFCDLETGYTLIRPFQQDKEGATLGGDEKARKLSIALAIGTSKSQRNVICHALKDFTDYAFEEAQRNLVERIGKNLEEYRARTVEKIKELGGDELLRRVEIAYGRRSQEWLAPDIGQIIAELRSIHDGMANANETWPAPAPAEPRRTDNVTEVAPATASSQTATAGPVPPEGQADPKPPRSEPIPTPAPVSPRASPCPHRTSPTRRATGRSRRTCSGRRTCSRRSMNSST